eukprot:Nk52_evm28s343 gene=Nk52_evmTU28s343
MSSNPWAGQKIQSPTLNKDPVALKRRLMLYKQINPLGSRKRNHMWESGKEGPLNSYAREVIRDNGEKAKAAQCRGKSSRVIQARKWDSRNVNMIDTVSGPQRSHMPKEYHPMKKRVVSSAPSSDRRHSIAQRNARKKQSEGIQGQFETKGKLISETETRTTEKLLKERTTGDTSDDLRPMTSKGKMKVSFDLSPADSDVPRQERGRLPYSCLRRSISAPSSEQKRQLPNIDSNTNGRHTVVDHFPSQRSSELRNFRNDGEEMAGEENIIRSSHPKRPPINRAKLFYGKMKGGGNLRGSTSGAYSPTFLHERSKAYSPTHSSSNDVDVSFCVSKRPTSSTMQEQSLGVDKMGISRWLSMLRISETSFVEQVLTYNGVTMGTLPYLNEVRLKDMGITNQVTLAKFQYGLNLLRKGRLPTGVPLKLHGFSSEEGAEVVYNEEIPKEARAKIVKTGSNYDLDMTMNECCTTKEQEPIECTDSKDSGLGTGGKNSLAPPTRSLFEENSGDQSPYEQSLIQEQNRLEERKKEFVRIASLRKYEQEQLVKRKLEKADRKLKQKQREAEAQEASTKKRETSATRAKQRRETVNKEPAQYTHSKSAGTSNKQEVKKEGAWLSPVVFETGSGTIALNANFEDKIKESKEDVNDICSASNQDNKVLDVILELKEQVLKLENEKKEHQSSTLTLIKQLQEHMTDIKKDTSNKIDSIMHEEGDISTSVWGDTLNSRGSTGESSSDDENFDFEIDVEDVKFSKQSVIGEGAFGKVFQGNYQGTDVAVKEWKGPISKTEKKYFIAEMKTLYQLRHPNIILFLGACTNRESPLMVLELMSSGSLYNYLHHLNGLVDHIMYFKIAKDIALGMNFLHKLRPPVIHYDLKSLNILIDNYGNAKISDLGIARLKSETAMKRKKVRQIGTPAWMAPELLEVDESNPATTKVDVYSYGVILWEILTRKQPYKSLTAAAIVSKVKQGHRPSIPPDCPAELNSLIKACWEQAPEKRPTFENILSMLGSLVFPSEWRVLFNEAGVKDEEIGNVQSAQFLIDVVHNSLNSATKSMDKWGKGEIVGSSDDSMQENLQNNNTKDFLSKGLAGLSLEKQPEGTAKPAAKNLLAEIQGYDISKLKKRAPIQPSKLTCLEDITSKDRSDIVSVLKQALASRRSVLKQTCESENNSELWSATG